MTGVYAYSAEENAALREECGDLLGQLDARCAALRDRYGILTEEDFSAMLAVDPRTVVLWRSQKRGPDYAKLGKKCFYRRVDVEKWIELQVVMCDRA